MISLARGEGLSPDSRDLGRPYTLWGENEDGLGERQEEREEGREGKLGLVHKIKINKLIKTNLTIILDDQFTSRYKKFCSFIKNKDID